MLQKHLPQKPVTHLPQKPVGLLVEPGQPQKLVDLLAALLPRLQKPVEHSELPLLRQMPVVELE